MTLLENQQQVGMPNLTFEPSDYRGTIRPRGDRPYGEHVSALHSQIFDAKSGNLTYKCAKDLCVADRELWMRYYRTWLGDRSVQRDAPRLATLMEEAIVALQQIHSGGGLSKVEQTHLEAMIENTVLRRNLFREIGGDKPREHIRELVRGSYSSLLAKRREELASQINTKS